MSVRRRAGLALLAPLGALAALAVRLVQVTAFAEAPYLGEARARAARALSAGAERGEIRDAKGLPLAYSEPGYDLWADRSALADPALAGRGVAGATGLDRAAVASRLVGRGTVRLAAGLSLEAAERVGALAHPALSLRRSVRRAYPLGAAAFHVLGVVDADSRGLEGLEFAWDGVLSGIPGAATVLRDGRGRDSDVGGLRIPATPGAAVRLTLDAAVQRIAHDEMSRAAAALGPSGGACVVMDPGTGDLLAVCSWPSCAPEDRARARPEEVRNRAVQDALEPGSVMKTFTLAWAVERGKAEPGEVIDCERGSWLACEGRTIHDSRPHGTLSLEEVLVHSSNVGAAKVGLRLGADSLRECLARFGFGSRPGAFPGESEGMLRPRGSWTAGTVVSVSFGHELAVTPLQLASGYAALVNGGLLVRPRLVKAVETAEGALLREFPRAPPERVVSEATSLWVRRTLARAVSEGTGRAVARLMRRGAQSSSVRVGGKTGTAMKYERDPETGEIRVSATRAVASFAGFAPAEAPALLCVVVWDEPEGARSGGLAAAPVVARILERVFVEMHGMADTSPRRHGGTEDSRSTPP